MNKMFLRRNGQRTRAAAMLEFVLIVPFALALMFITIDVGRLVMVSTAMHDASAAAARAGARQGYTGHNPAGTSQPCQENARTGNPSYDAFCEAARRIPGATIRRFEILSPESATSQLGRTCRRGGSNSNIYVTIRGTAEVELITPLLSQLLRTDLDGLGDRVVSIATARCEIARL